MRIVNVSFLKSRMLSYFVEDVVIFHGVNVIIFEVLDVLLVVCRGCYHFLWCNCYHFWSPGCYHFELEDIIIFHGVPYTVGYHFCYLFSKSANGIIFALSFFRVLSFLLSFDVIIFHDQQMLSFLRYHFSWYIFCVIIYVIIWCYHFLLSFPPFFLFPENVTHSNNLEMLKLFASRPLLLLELFAIRRTIS